jgi:hypothetical protein
LDTCRPWSRASGGSFGDEWALIPVVYLARPFAFTRDRLSVQFTAFPALSGANRDGLGLKTQLRGKYKLLQFVSSQLIYNRYDTSDATDADGQHGRRDNFGRDVNYQF